MVNLGWRDCVVVGGGVVGGALAWGLARAGTRPLVLDEDDLAPRASRANNALVWVQGKGAGLPEYALWSLDSAGLWPRFAAELKADSGIDVGLSQRGGYSFYLTSAEMDADRQTLERIGRETGGRSAPYEVLDHPQTLRRFPGFGPTAAGSIFCPRDGHVNALRLLHALHAAMAARGCEYRACHPVQALEPCAGGLRLRGPWGEVSAAKVVLAAGLGNERLAPMAGLESPLKRSKGQIIITEKCEPFFPYASTLILQSDEGGIMIGASQEPRIDSILTGQAVNAVLAKRAILAFPRLAELGVVRTWAGFRIKTPDGYPIYEQSQDAPGAFVATCHSGVTLAANHALVLAPWIREGRLDPGLAPYSARRFRVPKDL
jgi:glycine/D-amino acid oxidase-like deaminating enzyme